MVVYNIFDAGVKSKILTLKKYVKSVIMSKL